MQTKKMIKTAILIISSICLMMGFYSSTKGGNNDKVTVCHNGHSITISKNALSAHIAHGDQIRCLPSY